MLHVHGRREVPVVKGGGRREGEGGSRVICSAVRWRGVHTKVR